MDLEDWELLADDDGDDAGRFLVVDGGKGLFAKEAAGLGRKGLVDVNYFICPRDPPTEKKKKPGEDFVKEIKEVMIASPPPPVVMLSPAAAAKQDVISQVSFFRKLGENTEFVDMKMDSPKSSWHQKEETVEESRKGDEGLKQEDLKVKSEEEEEERKEYMVSGVREKGEACCWEGFGLGIWRWKGVTGIGALCSIGVAAATICILILGGRGQRQKQQQQSQKIQFQIYTDDKSIKHVVHHATRLNHVISAARGVPMTRAHISFGGYYDGL